MGLDFLNVPLQQVSLLSQQMRVLNLVKSQ
jgi:hypothetical protein